jgi:hypothetical protein
VVAPRDLRTLAAVLGIHNKHSGDSQWVLASLLNPLVNECVARRPRASTRNSPSIPTLRAGRLATPGGSRRGLPNPLVNDVRRGSAAGVDAQFPVDPRYAGPLAGWLAPLVAVELLNPLPPFLRLE